VPGNNLMMPMSDQYVVQDASQDIELMSIGRREATHDAQGAGITSSDEETKQPANKESTR
jgi:hypothetical protein